MLGTRLLDSSPRSGRSPATEFIWYQANRALQLAGGEGYHARPAHEKILRDFRIFPIFEGANDVLRTFVALSGLKPLGDKLRV